MKRVIKSILQGLEIEISEIAGKEERLLEAFQECREGRCSCPTDEYLKLDSLEIENSAGTISLRLKAKKGRKLNTTEIQKCLNYTDEKANSTK